MAMAPAVKQFDYDLLDNDTQVFLHEKAESIKVGIKRNLEDIITIGRDLMAVKAKLPHGQFGHWLVSELDGLTERTAQRFMAVAERFGENDNVSFLPASVLYELAAPSTPDAVVEQVVSGEVEPTLEAVKQAKKAATTSKPKSLEPYRVSTNYFNIKIHIKLYKQISDLAKARQIDKVDVIQQAIDLFGQQ